ncbi:DUF6191 domain-containing protein [Streptomyces sp. NPDC001455]|uniref:DUF6191 domain-containing protein n=1 Tax=unclassified Streptomyces TaxID=2593676 RepID=UPI003322284E
MFNFFEEIFAPGRRHAAEERKRLELSRVDLGVGDPGRGPIDLASGKVVVRAPGSGRTPGAGRPDDDGCAPPAGRGPAPEAVSRRIPGAASARTPDMGSATDPDAGPDAEPRDGGASQGGAGARP